MSETNGFVPAVSSFLLSARVSVAAVTAAVAAVAVAAATATVDDVHDRSVPDVAVYVGLTGWSPPCPVVHHF